MCFRLHRIPCLRRHHPCGCACAEAFAQPPPPGFLLAIRGERFVLGDPISAAGRRNLRDAVEFYRQLLSDISMQAWRAATRNKP